MSFHQFEPDQSRLGDETIGAVIARVSEAHRLFDWDRGRHLLVNSTPSNVFRIGVNVGSHQNGSTFKQFPNDLIRNDTERSSKQRGIDRREQCRISQSRYRKRQKLLAMQLEESVKRLRKEVAYLKRVARPQLSCKQSPWAIVVEVYRHVEESLSLWRKVDFVDMVHDINLQTFLGECFSPDVTMGDISGVDALVEQLQHYAENFGDPKLQLHRIESMAPGVMKATGSLHVTVTELSLRKLFTAQGRLDTNSHTALCECLVNQRLCYSCTTTFLFDDCDRVERLEVSIDLVNPFFQVFCSLKDVTNTLLMCSKVT
ncbi:Bzip transcription factor [Phytophthora megakarya]|uniref:Bzip transcription factor n=1 Tax=Phytophthora megakarya TaxID=4795 RepID=A0A225VSN6_9STRA|nr:Bzip transcription factor [Phytophthora megakarya]